MKKYLEVFASECRLDNALIGIDIGMILAALTHLLDEDVLDGFEEVRLAHRVCAADPKASPGAVPSRVDLQSFMFKL